MLLERRFRELFVGSGLSHGKWHKDKGAETIKEPAAEADYDAHLRGDVGLGLVPVRDDGTCRFAAIDVDVDTVDHARVYLEVKRRRLPLVVCRSKSGGVHLYVFAPEPGLAASEVREKLTLWASLLGFPSSEIFPKQTKTTKKNLGNWINLPYFAADKTTRYALGDAGALSLVEFLDTIKAYDPKAFDADEGIDATGGNELPPCLKCLSQTGVPEGSRNSGMFNFGVFFRKSDPQGWQDRLHQFNLVNVKPPLSFRELQTIAKSLSHARYQYTCEQSPIRELCDRPTCLKLKFGVVHKPWEELDQFDQLMTSNLRKVLTTPPRYILEVNGHNVTLAFEEFQSFARFSARALADLDLILKPMKQQSWLLLIKDLLKTKTDIEAPADASPEGLVRDAFSDFIALRDRARSADDILKGVPVEANGRIVFRINDFRRYAQARRLDLMDTTELYTILREQGCKAAHVSIKGRKLFAWSMPLEAVNEQTEDFDVAAETPDEEKLP